MRGVPYPRKSKRKKEKIPYCLKLDALLHMLTTFLNHVLDTSQSSLEHFPVGPYHFLSTSLPLSEHGLSTCLHIFYM